VNDSTLLAGKTPTHANGRPCCHGRGRAGSASGSLADLRPARFGDVDTAAAPVDAYGESANGDKQRSQREEREHILAAARHRDYLEPDGASDSAGNSSACPIERAKASALRSVLRTHNKVAWELTTRSHKTRDGAAHAVMTTRRPWHATFEEGWKKGCQDERSVNMGGNHVHEVCRCVNDSADIIRSPRGQIWDEDNTRSASESAQCFAALM
jgi:hypothetical protein